MLSTIAVILYSVFNYYFILCIKGLVVGDDEDKSFAFYDPFVQMKNEYAGIC